MPKQKGEMTWREAITMIMNETKTVMNASEITEKIIERKLRTHIGATPSATVGAHLYTLAKKENPLFIQVGPGQFIINNKRGKQLETIYPDDTTVTTEPCGILTAFGMFWRRELVDWKNKPQLFGCQLTGSEKVNFCDQLGVYFLYDGREVIYVGRATERSLGIRLYEHTKDRLATRWDRFSWFGVLPISEEGKLGQMPASFSSDEIIPAFEALLIEALEPRQNRKRGDDTQAVEFIQVEDPALHKKRLQDEFSKLLDRNN